jgi:hypothetical protein
LTGTRPVVMVSPEKVSPPFAYVHFHTFRE